MELTRSLPDLVEELRALRKEMARKTDLYDSLLRTSSSSSHSSSHSSSDPMRPPTAPDHDPIFTPSASKASALSMSFLHRSAGGPSTSGRTPSQAFSAAASKPADTYTVTYVSGDCGIALRNYAKRDTKVGAQIAMLHHADGVTAGMSKCRLGDQLLKINNESVTSWPFAEIVETLEIARRPISLTFRTTANVHTSPRASTSSLASTSLSSMSSTSSTSSTSSMHFSSSLLHRKAKSTSEMEPEDSARSKVSMHALFSRSRSSKATHRWKKDQRLQDGGDVVDNGREGYDSVRSTCDGVDDRHDHSSVVTDRRRDTDQHPHPTLSSCYDSRGRETTTTTTTSVRASVLSEDVEMWCREQEEMHSDIIMLLTETVMRCERLQQENLDQLQSLMQLSVNSPSCRSDCSSAASSYAGGEKSGKGDKCLEFIDGDAAGPAAETSSTSSSPRA